MLTIQLARELAPGHVLKCHVVPGLELHAGSTGKTWKLYYRGRGGKQRRPKIGDFPALSIEAARRVAREWKEAIALGRDPSEERKELRKAPTVSDLFAEFDAHVICAPDKPYAESTALNVRGIFRNHVIPEIGSMLVCDVTVADVNRTLTKIGAKHPVAATAARAYLSRAFRLAETDSRKWRPKGSNPCRDPEIVSYPKRNRVRKMEADEFARVQAALRLLSGEYPWHVAAIYVMLLAGSRVTELCTAKRSDVVIGSDGAHISRSDHKTQRYVERRTIRLGPEAVRILTALPTHPSGYLFGPIGELKCPRRAIWEVWDKARARAGCSDLQPRDMRRTFASVAKTQGVSLDQIGELFDHRSTATTDGYAWLFKDAAQSIVERVEARIQGLLEAPRKAADGD